MKTNKKYLIYTGILLMVILFLNFVCAAKSFDINDPSTYLDNPGDVYEAMKDPGQLKKINDNIAGMSTLNRITVRRTIFEQANPGMIPPNTPGLASKEFIFLERSNNEKLLFGNAEKGLVIDVKKLPKDLKTMEFKSDEIVLEGNKGTKISLGKGFANADGTIKAFEKINREEDILVDGKPKVVEGKVQKSHTPALERINGGKLISLADIKFNSDAGSLEISEKGIRLSGDVSFSIGGVAFSRNSQDKTPESLVSFGEDRIVLNGARGSYSDSSGEVLSTGTKASDGALVMYFGNPEKALAKTVSFGDYKYLEAESSYSLMPAGKINFQFDDSGKLTHVKKDGEWVSVDGDLTQGDLRRIYVSSSEMVQELIKKANSGESVKLSDISGRFDKSPDHVAGGKTISIDSRPNFVSINGNSIGVGGKGSIELSRDIDELIGIEASGFRVKSGDITIAYKNGNINIDRKDYDNAFSIANINTIYNGKFSGEALRINQNSDKYFVITESDRVKLTRVATSMEMMGSALTESYVEIPRTLADELRKSGSSLDREKFIEKMLASEFSINTRISGVQLPEFLTSVSPSTFPGDNQVSGDSALSAVGNAIAGKIAEEVESRFSNIGGQLYELRTDALNKGRFAREVSEAVKAMGAVNLNDMNVQIKNNPGDYPSLVISSGRNSQEIQLKDKIWDFVVTGTIRDIDTTRATSTTGSNFINLVSTLTFGAVKSATPYFTGTQLDRLYSMAGLKTSNMVAGLGDAGFQEKLTDDKEGIIIPKTTPKNQ